MVLIPDFEKRRDKLAPIEFVPVKSFFKPQRKIKMRQDVNGWADRSRRLKWHLAAGQTYYIDSEKALEFIVKGYATGELPRPVSDSEKEHLLSEMTRIGINKNEVLSKVPELRKDD